uniref:(California timema) hypothetical protein n=1 Tax=Timema californicum TaxID=61474 RepID=A0A7R9IY77_TIMCA|nr:unnamed protein product [Timema californicum]
MKGLIQQQNRRDPPPPTTSLFNPESTLYPSPPTDCRSGLVSTGTGIMSHFVNLHIVVPEAFILGSGEHHVDVGSGISLVCIIEKSPTPPQYVFWYHNDRMINYDTSRGGITVETEPGPKTQSRLTIRDAHDTDSGNYTCSASNTEPASIFVFVSEVNCIDIHMKTIINSITKFNLITCVRAVELVQLRDYGVMGVCGCPSEWLNSQTEHVVAIPNKAHALKLWITTTLELTKRDSGGVAANIDIRE